MLQIVLAARVKENWPHIEPSGLKERLKCCIAELSEDIIF